MKKYFKNLRFIIFSYALFILACMFLRANKWVDYGNTFLYYTEKKGCVVFQLVPTLAFWVGYLIPNYNYRSKSHSVLLCFPWFPENVLHWYYHWGTSNLLAYHNAITMLIFYHFIETTVLLKSLSYLTEKSWIQKFRILDKSKWQMYKKSRV